MNKNEIRIVLADSHKMVREGLRALLGAKPDLPIVGDAGDGLEARRLVEQIKPDILLTDLMMAGINGLEIARQVSRQSLGTRVIILTMHADDRYVREAPRNGAAGYVLKTAFAADLVKAIRKVKAGRYYLSPDPSGHRPSRTYVQKIQKESLDCYDTLTTREREVLQLSAEGRTLSDIGQRLFISPRTAEIHRANLMRKLGLKNTLTELLRYAIARRIVRPGAGSPIIGASVVIPTIGRIDVSNATPQHSSP